MSIQQFEHDGFNSPKEVEVAQRLALENEKLNMAYAECRKDEREASCVDELVAALQHVVDYLTGSATRNLDTDRAEAASARAVLEKLEQTK